MAAYSSGKSIYEVTVEDFERVLSTGCRQTLSFNIFQILFQVQSVDIRRLELINAWIVRRTPLLSVAFPGDGYGKFRERPSTYVYPKYNIMQNNWPYRCEKIINPSQIVLEELKLIVDIISEKNAMQTSRNRRAEMRCNPEDDLAPACQVMRCNPEDDLAPACQVMRENTEEIVPIPGPSLNESVTCNICPIICTEERTEQISEPIPGPSFNEPVTCNICPIICTEERTEQISEPIPGPSFNESVTCNICPIICTEESTEQIIVHIPGASLDEPVASTTYQIGDIVNTKVPGEPYVAGIINSIAGDQFYILFPYSKYGISELLFQRNEIRPYKSQFPEGIFQPIYLTQNMSRDAQRRMIKRHEERASQYKQHKV
ncbi:hypothetical protein QTP88_027031 [Uroleucon formosanum]